MQSANEDRWIAVAGLALSVALVLDWMAGNWLPIVPWALRAAAMAVAASLGFYTLYRCWSRKQRSHEAAEAYLEEIARMDPRQWATGLPPQPFEQRRREGWPNLCERLAASLEAAGRRIQELEQLQASQELLPGGSRIEDAILAALPDPVIAVDSGDTLVHANPSAQRLFDLSSLVVEHPPLDEVLRCHRLLGLLADARSGAAPPPGCFEVEIADRHGESRWYNVTAHALPVDFEFGGSDDETAPAAMAVLRDISRQKSLRQRNADFVSAVSHEMKTPLSGIKAYVELLADGDAEDIQTQNEFLAVITGQANRLERLIDNLLNLARIEAGVVSARRQSWSLNELLQGALDVVRPAAERKQINLVSELSPFHSGVIVDREMLLDAAINLLSNAINYTRPGGRVVLRSRRVGHSVLFEVQDTGVGLTPTDCRKIFEKFYRVQKDKDMAVGTGLGLPLARHIVEDVHGGRLTVMSVPGEGSTFTVALPTAPIAPALTPALAHH